MKKVIGVALTAAALVAMLPASASAYDTIGSHKGCRQSMILAPCPNTMPPSSSGSNNGWTRGGGSGSGSTSGSGSGTSTRGGGINTRPAVPPTK